MDDKQQAIRNFFKGGEGVERKFVEKLCLFPLKMCSTQKSMKYIGNQPFS